MKRLFFLFLLLTLLLGSCSADGAGMECRDGICISLTIEEPVQALEPIPFTITVKTDKDISDLGISLSGDATVTILDIEKTPSIAEVGYQNETSVGWLINTKSRETYIFSGHVIFAKPTVSYGVFHYDILVEANQPTIARVTDSVIIYLDAEGKQIDDEQAKRELETELPLPTMPSNMTIVPETPLPTIVWPSATPLPSSAPPAYPAPENGVSGQDGTVPTEIPAYPAP